MLSYAYNTRKTPGLSIHKKFDPATRHARSLAQISCAALKHIPDRAQYMRRAA